MTGKAQGATGGSPDPAEFVLSHFRFFRRILGLDEALGGLDLFEEEVAQRLSAKGGEEVSWCGVPQGGKPEILHLHI